jgi:hypothetical protein
MVAAVFRLRDALECMYCGAARQATERGIHSLSSGREQSRSSTSLPGLRSRLRGGGVETCAFAAVLRKRPAAARCCMSLRAADLTTLMVAKSTFGVVCCHWPCWHSTEHPVSALACTGDLLRKCSHRFKVRVTEDKLNSPDLSSIRDSDASILIRCC